MPIDREKLETSLAQVDLCDALLAIGACEEAVEWVRSLGLAKASEVLKVARRQPRKTRTLGGQLVYARDVVWLAKRLGCSRTASADQIREAMIQRIRGSTICGCLSCAKRDAALRRVKAQLRAAGRLP